MKISFAMYAGTTSTPAVSFAYLKELGVTNFEIRAAAKVIGKTVASHCQNALQIRNQRVPVDFRRSSSKEFPIFEYSGNGDTKYVVPSRELLLLRITDGLYYDIVQDADARRSAGDHFESLCGLILHHYLGGEAKISGEKPTSYGMSSDFLLTQPETNKTLFVECKARRIPNRVLTSADPWHEFGKDFEDIIKGVCQIWRSQNEFFPEVTKEHVGIVLCYDPWTVMGGDFKDALIKKAHAEADKFTIPEGQRIPVALVGYADFEQCIRKYSFDDLIASVPASEGNKNLGYNLLFTLDEVATETQGKPHFEYSDVTKAAVQWWSFN